jgi:hypothetical protein
MTHDDKDHDRRIRALARAEVRAHERLALVRGELSSIIASLDRMTLPRRPSRMGSGMMPDVIDLALRRPRGRL